MSDHSADQNPGIAPVKIPTSPKDSGPDPTWEHFSLYRDVRQVLYTLPSFFQSDLSITDILATDLHSFNTGLGSTIEEQIVKQLNRLRTTWDPKEKYTAYRFVRQPQRFPDVLLRAVAPGVTPDILMGIELKGWYALAKESEPSFRFGATPGVCAPADLLAVYPWALSNVVSGSPRLFEPYLVHARFAAEYRNYHWEHLRRAKGATGIRLSNVSAPYPETKSEKIIDVPLGDDSGNFGRFARTKLMDPYITNLMQQTLVGIPLFAWQQFLTAFREDASEEEISKALNVVTRRVRVDLGGASKAEAIAERLLQIYKDFNLSDMANL